MKLINRLLMLNMGTLLVFITPLLLTVNAVSQTGTNLTPVVVRAVAPVYPATAIATNSEGKVVLTAKINREGHVTSVIQVDGHPLLRSAAENAAKKWVFQPIKDPAEVRLTFSFALVPKSSSSEDLTAIFLPPFEIQVNSRPYEPIVHLDPRHDQ